MSIVRTAAVAMPMVAVMIGCSTEEPETDRRSRSAVRDSADIRIVTHDAKDDRILEARMELDFFEPDDAGLLHRVVGGALGEEVILIGNGSTNEILVYAEDGRPMGTWGGEGDGPEEFRNIQWLQWVKEDVVAVSDAGRNRITLWDLGGTVQSELDTRMEPHSAMNEGLGAVPQGTPMWVSDSAERMIGSPPVRFDVPNDPGLFSVHTMLVVAGPSEGEPEDLGTVRASRMYATGDEDQPFMPIHPSQTLQFSGNFERMAVADPIQHEMRVFDDAQETVNIRELRRRVPSEADVEGGPAHPVDSLPTYTGLQVDQERRIWVALPTGEESVPNWKVFGRDGGYLATVVFPQRGEVLDARGDEVLFLMYDALDVETVVRGEVPGLSQRNGNNE